MKKEDDLPSYQHLFQEPKPDVILVDSLKVCTTSELLLICVK